MNDTKVSRLTASKYLQKMVGIGLLEMKKHKNTNYYINTKLLRLFTELSSSGGRRGI